MFENIFTKTGFFNILNGIHGFTEMARSWYVRAGQSIWAPVSEPGFLDFQIFDSRDVFFLQNLFERYVGEISRNK